MNDEAMPRRLAPAARVRHHPFRGMRTRDHTHAERAYLQTRARLPCAAADWSGGSERFTAVVLLVFAVVAVVAAASLVI
jgi:hypothetical protein